jgi:hypothetical protein
MDLSVGGPGYAGQRENKNARSGDSSAIHLSSPVAAMFPGAADAHF